ncbi:MAG: hypothetical protein NTV21_14750 [Planctomycetota bacterium]|nr:hypothetical protein [Planctomycetota bacterium]
MHTVLRTPNQALISLTNAEMLVLTDILRHARHHRDLGESEFRLRFGADRESASALHDAMLATPRQQQLETAEVWAEPGSSVMLRAITVHGDPVELSEHEAREFAERLRQAIEASE